MMEIEKKFATTDLSELKDAPLKLFAKHCVQYQDFKTNVALQKFNCKILGLKESTIKLFFDGALSYIKYGVKTNGVKRKLFNFIDEIINTNQFVPLTPSLADKRRQLTRNKSKKYEINVPVIKKEQPKLIEKFVYGIRKDNTIMLFDTEREQNAFIQGYKFANGIDDLKKIILDKELIEEAK